MSEVEENQEEISVEEDVDRTVSRFVLQSPPTEQNAVFSCLIYDFSPNILYFTF